MSSLAYPRPFQEPELRKLVMNYYNAECERMKRAYPFIGLYRHDPNLNPKNPILLQKPSDCPEGHIETNYTFPYMEFSDKDLISKCLGFWVAYLEAGRIVHSSCIKTNPNWMYNIRNEIAHMTMNCLMIPGTHNSGLFFKYNQYQDTVYEKYMFSQDESIFSQLVYGIRFLDLRVWHEGSSIWKSKIQITHDKFHLGLPLLQDILNDVKRFIKGTKEFVIIDFHRFFSGVFMSKTLSKWQHREIVKMVKNTFGDTIIDNELADLKLKKLWKMDKRVLIAYKHEIDSPYDNYVIPSVTHWWDSSLNIKSLHKYLVDNSCSQRLYCTASVAVLTPTAWTPLTDLTYSRRKAADEVSKFVDKWYRNELSCANIVLTDFFLGNNIIGIAEEANKNHSRCDIRISDYFSDDMTEWITF